MKIFIGCDHGGYNVKEELIPFIKSLGHEVIDLGTHSNESVDYPIYGHLVGHSVVENPNSMGIVICGSGIGISISANKVKGVRCALCHDHYTAELCRKHNDANIIAFGARVTGIEVIKDAIITFLSTSI
eukprot:gnl/Chilomastix_caulleri/1204.p1 GENE.gnl/Chilomastix_caulleri/1204~~gnl/Chilomastix_caulleri/1204.p1  ORF type:complete len:129 (-),score=36.49 gnl/Chilomastix_caulleri/1204:81-467(-)